MKLKIKFFQMVLIISCFLIVPIAHAQSCCDKTPPSNPGPGGDHPDDNYSVSSDSPSFSYITEAPYFIALLEGYLNGLTNLADKLKDGYVYTDIQSGPDDLLTSSKLLIIPSGGLYGLEKSAFFKASLDEYVKKGGTLIVFAQQRGYEFSVLPVPQEEDGSYRTIGGRGWSEDISCFWGGSYIDTWHQILSGQSRSMPSLNIDGYFTSYPSNSTIILRKTGNGQPALLMYEYGQGRVLVTSMYSDVAFMRYQASSEEIALVRDMVSWAKEPDELPEVMPGETVNLQVTITNSASSDASSVKLLIYNPDRTTLLSEQNINVPIAAGQFATIPVTYVTTQRSALGIYHIDYTLYDSSGNIIQSQAETNSGRFVVSSPPQVGYGGQGITYDILTDAEKYISGELAIFTIRINNHTKIEKQVKAKYDQEQTITIPPGGTGVITYTKIVSPLSVSFYDQTGLYLGFSYKAPIIYSPSTTINIIPDKPFYIRGDSATLSCTLKNNVPVNWQSVVKMTIRDSSYKKMFEDTKTVSLSSNGITSINISFVLPPESSTGTYNVWTEVFSGAYRVSTSSKRFEVIESQISVQANLPSVFGTGTNTIPFTISNTGKVSVSSGSIDLSLRSPGGNIVYSGSQPFSLAVGESATLDIPITIPSLELGNYVLTYSQSDETKAGKPTSIAIPNYPNITNLSFDRTSYKVRETANLAVTLTNRGKFNLENISVTVSAPDVNFTESQAISLGVDASTSLIFAIPIPETVSAGVHNVSVTVTLPSEDALVKNASFTVPESKLTIDYPGTTTLAAGDTISLSIENTGGVDTTYTTQKLSINDNHGVEIYQGSATGTILTGEKKTLVDIQIPAQALNGPAYLHVQMRDSKTGKTAYYDRAIEIRGLMASLQTMTDKNAYLITEAITGISSILNGPYGIEKGSLKVSVSKISQAATGQFTHFLPKRAWWPLNYPYGVAVSPDGSVYVADTDNHRIQKFDSNGNFIMKWGSEGSGDRQFEYPYSIAIGPDGSVYVADSGNHRIQKFDSNGNFITKWGSYCNTDTNGDGVPDQPCDGQFNYAEAIAVGPDGSVYVADDNQRIQKFDSSGNFITKWGNSCNTDTNGDGIPDQPCDGQFNYALGIAIGPDGSVFVVDTGNHRIQRFNNNGNFVAKWGIQCIADTNWDGIPEQSCEGQFYYPGSISIGPDGFVYVADSGNSRVQKFDYNGNFITKWGNYCYIDSDGDGVPDQPCDGQFEWPEGIAIGPDGFVYVADSGNNRVQKFDSNGNFITKWGSGSAGAGDGEFQLPFGVAVGSDQSIYVTDSRGNRIQKFDSSGNFITKWGSLGSEDGQFNGPIGIAVGPDGSVYVTDTGNNRIQKFDSSGNFIAKWVSFGVEEGFSVPLGIVVGSDGSVYVADTYNYRIEKFDRNGNLIREWEFYAAECGEGSCPPLGIAVGPDGSVYVTDRRSNRVHKFDSSGNLITEWGGYCSTDSDGDGVPDQPCDGQFYWPEGIAIGTDGSVYVTDSRNNRIQKFDSSGNFIAKWGSYGSEDGQFYYPVGIEVAPEGSIYVVDTGNHRIQKMITVITEYVAETLFETTAHINQPASTTQDYTTNIGTLNVTGKLLLQAILKNSLGQTMGQASYPFYIVDGNTVLLFNTDRKVYKLGDTVTITGQIENRASIEAVGLTLTLNSKLNTQNSELVFTETFNIPAGGTQPFTITTTAGVEGTVTLTGKVTQNNSTLVEITDQYGVAKSNVSVAVSMPDVTGSGPFNINVEIRNTGKVDATVQFGVQSPDFGDSQTITIPPGEIKILQYSQQISMDTSYTFTFTGDLEQTLIKTVLYGLAASIAMNPQAVSPEGNVAIPFTITNTGQLVENVAMNFTLTPGDITQTKTYYLQPGGSATDTLYFDLSEGDYQITAASQRPDVTAQANFLVRKENQVEMEASLGTQTDGLIPVNVNLTNLGFNEINGSVNISVTGSSGQTVWNGEETLSQLSPQSSQLVNFIINPSAIEPGNYTLQAQLLNNSNQLIAARSLEFGVQSANFQITQLPPYQTFMAGQEATFVFRVRNIGSQEGSFDLRFRAYDLIDSTQREWLKPNEEKTISFGFILPEDLEEKDYFADYELKASVVAGQSKGQIKYHLAGINLNVNASLDKPYYNEGETAHLTINIQSTNPNPQNLFARVNYAGFEPQQTFTLNGNQVLIFDVPLPKITGEKLFYGIYHEGGRSIHLNSLYIHKAGDVITITTDKQVYNAGETVTVTASGDTSGTLTLSGPGGYTETFTFTGSATKSFPLPSTVAAGTYFINAQLSIPNSELVTAVHPFDVAGIQVKVLECNNDKGKYASSDTIATSFTISSNTTLPAILKAWIVDPKGQYTSVGEQSTTLSSSESLLITYNSALNTSVSGIHRLVYGIYGPEDLLLCSGSEAFDVGDAVLMGLSTDKRDYPTNTEPVIVTASLFGSVSAELQLELDGAVIKSETISLNEFTSYTTELQNITPGPHVLKGTLTAGGLKSTKETSFTYALAFMPRPQISASPAYLDFGSINLGSASTQTITLSSAGNADLVIGAIALSGTNQGEFSIQNDTCSGRPVAPSGTCTLDVFFSPTSLGAKSASLFIPSNATEMPTLYLSLEGAGATTLNLLINPTGSGRVTGTGIDCPGDCTESFSTSGASIQLTAIPTQCYRFANWTGDINSSENPVTVNMDTNKNVTANFAVNTFTITATASLGGNISPSGAVTVNCGANQTFFITSNPGYHIVNVLVDGVSIGAVLTHTFDNVTSNHTIEAIFAINQYIIIATAGPNGTIIPSGAITVNHGGSLTFTMVPDAGYCISDVKVDGITIGAKATYTFTDVTASHTIEAIFAINQHTIIATVGSNGTITPSGTVTVDDGGSQTFTITPNPGYRISDVEVDGVMLGVTKSYTFSNVASDHTINVTFKQIQVISLPFSDDFEDDPVGTQPNLPWDNFNGGPAMVTGSGSHSPANSISVSSGPEGSGSAFVNLGETYPDRIAYEVWAKVNSTASSAYIGFSEEILNMIPQFNAVYFNGTDGKVYFTSADRDHGFTVPILNNFTIGVWHKVRVQIDFANLIADVFIDDVRVGSGLQISPKDALWEQDGTHSFQLNKIGVTHGLGEPFYFDDFSVSEWNPNTPVGLLRSAGPGQWAVLGMGGIGSASSTSISMSGSSSIRGTVANTGVANAGNVNMSGSSLINGILSLNTAGRLNKSGTSAVAGGVQQNTATDGVLDQAVADALAASQSAAALPATITSITRVTISNPSQNITITGGLGTNVLYITNIAISNGTLTLSAPHGGCFIMNVSGSFALSGASRIVLAGGITPSDVLYNFVGSGGGVAMSGGSSVTGILLAPQRGITLSSSTVTGEIISGGSQIAFSGTTQVNNPGH